ncbi:MAG: hypothetical protein BWY26_01269 [Elusimicrobia bacterium ADurb.Bin231]|nr:MAG: hypothetical protein BWY26_01269 [Elusimicrobia bacterium ADurb.Bin231]
MRCSFLCLLPSINHAVFPQYLRKNHYFYNAIEVKSKFALLLDYKRLNSKNMTDFYRKFKEVCPVEIKCWQTDNGIENLGVFEEQLSKRKYSASIFISEMPENKFFH